MLSSVKMGFEENNNFVNIWGLFIHISLLWFMKAIFMEEFSALEFIVYTKM